MHPCFSLCLLILIRLTNHGKADAEGCTCSILLVKERKEGLCSTSTQVSQLCSAEWLSLHYSFSDPMSISFWITFCEPCPSRYNMPHFCRLLLSRPPWATSTKFCRQVSNYSCSSWPIKYTHLIPPWALPLITDFIWTDIESKNDPVNSINIGGDSHYFLVMMNRCTEYYGWGYARLR